MRMFENRVLRRIFGLREVGENCIMMRWAGRVACIGYFFLVALFNYIYISLRFWFHKMLGSS
jgi:hypothetical protein